MAKSENNQDNMCDPNQFHDEMNVDRPENIQENTYIPNQLGRRVNLYITAAAANIPSFLSGISIGWMATMQPILQGEDSPVGPVSDMDVSWLASIMYLSRFITIMFYTFAIDRFGHKKTGYMVVAPFTVGYAMSLFARTVPVLYCARFVLGMAAGGNAILAPSYCSDIAEDVNKGKLSVLFGLSQCFGVTFSYIVGYYASYTMFHMCCLAASVVFVFILCWLPESPVFLLITDRAEKSKKALQWLRNGEECELEFERLKCRAQEILEKKNRKVRLRTMMDTPTKRALLIGMGLMANQQLCGCTVIATYTVAIFQEAGSTISPNICTILVGILMNIGTFISSMMIERCGRRVLLIASNIISAISLCMLGTYLYFQHLGWDLKSAGWIPFTCLSIYIFTTGLGFSSLPFTMVTELVNSHARATVQAIVMMFLSLLVFITVFCYMPLTHVIGQHGCFWFFSAMCVIATVCIYLVLPETKNRSLEEVILQLNSRNYIQSVVSWSMKNRHVENKLSSSEM